MHPVDAGVGTYDVASKSFPLTYIYLDLPNQPGALDQAQVSLSIQRTAPQPEQSQTVNRFLTKVSQKLSDVTSGRAKIGSLNEVQDIKKANIVISLSGSVMPLAGGAWAGMHGFQQGGTVNLYYLDLARENSDDIVNTVVHELCHYFFALPDEYPAPGNFDRLCPLNGPGVDRCLMDNFHQGVVAGLLCTSSDHNPRAPGSNGYTPVEPQGDSCRKILDDFFNKLGVQPGPASVIPDATLKLPKPNLTPAQKESVLKKAQDFLKKLKGQGKTGGLNAQDRKQVLGHVFAGVFDTLKDQVGKFDLAGLAKDLAGSLILTPLGVPPGLQVIEKVLIAKAFDLAKGLLSRDRGSNSDDIERKLLEFAAGELRKQPVGASPPFGEDEAAYISNLAKQAAAGNTPNQPETIEQLRDQLSIEIYQTLNALANNLNMPGAVDRGDSLRRLVGGIQLQGKIPNRTLRFGRRRTVLIEPPILVAEGIQPFKDEATQKMIMTGIDDLQTQGGPENYNTLRGIDTVLFSKLIDRNRIDVVSGISLPTKNERVANDPMDDIKVGVVDLKASNFGDVFDVDTKAGKIDSKPDKQPKTAIDQGLTAGILEKRRARLFDLLAVVKDQIERDLIENIVVVVPPGGIPDEFADPIASLGEQFVGKSDLRIDIAAIGSATIPWELRDLVARTKGSILTITDRDEIGSIAQRLAGEQTQGTWITIPQQDMLVIDQVPDFASFGPGEYRPIYDRLRGIRARHIINTAGNDAPKVVLRPFYVDDSNDYDLIIGLTQPLTLAGWPSTFKLGDHDGPLITRTDENLRLVPDPQIRLMADAIRDPAQVAKMEMSPLSGLIFAPTRLIVFDRAKSSPTTLVFKLPGSKTGSGTGWFTPVLTLSKNHFMEISFHDDKKSVAKPRHYNENVVHFTFSVGTATSKAQMVANLIQDDPKPGFIVQRGTIGPDKVEAIVTASLTAGAAVLDAEVVGFVQKIDLGIDDITTARITFKDDGKAPDVTLADGIYTASIPLDARRANSTEYRVFIDGHSVEGKSKFVPAGEAIPRPGEDNKTLEDAAKALRDRPAPVFQRATSIHFAVPSNNNR